MSNFPPTVNYKLKTMNYEQKILFKSEFKRRKKSIFVGYICLVFLGWHYAYVRKWGTQLVCIITLWGLLVWWLIDWFRIPLIVKRYNDDLSVKILYELSTIFQTNEEKIKTKEFIEIDLNEASSMSINDYYSNLNK